MWLKYRGPTLYKSYHFVRRRILRNLICVGSFNKRFNLYCAISHSQRAKCHLGLILEQDYSCLIEKRRPYWSFYRRFLAGLLSLAEHVNRRREDLGHVLCIVRESTTPGPFLDLVFPAIPVIHAACQ